MADLFGRIVRKPSKLELDVVDFSCNVLIPSEVMARQLGAETVILDLANSTYYGLDPVGARMWQLMTDGQTLAQLCETILVEYNVSREDVERDVQVLVQTLLDKKLVSIVRE